MVYPLYFGNRRDGRFFGREMTLYILAVDFILCGVQVTTENFVAARIEVDPAAAEICAE